MFLLENNPLTHELHRDWKKRLANKFREKNFPEDSEFISIINYLDNAPEKFFFTRAFDDYLRALNTIATQDPVSFSTILNDSISTISISNRILTEINQLSIHDIHLPNEHEELINFIDKQVHYNLLKLYETPFFQFTYLVAKYRWMKKKKGTDGLDLYNSFSELKNDGFDYLEPIYLHNVRNGIAHGKVIFTDQQIIYIDKKGNKEQIPIRKIIDVFDKALDVVNGFCLAFKVFCFSNLSFLEKNKIEIPHSILIEELQSKCNAPGWTITNCLESLAKQNKRQLMIYVKNGYWDFWKVQWGCFITAYWAEKLTQSYDRLFFSLRSKHAKMSTIGWAAFDGNKLKALRQNNEAIEAYGGVLEGNLIYFIPKIKFPKIVYKVSSILSIWKTTFPIHWRNYINTYFPRPFILRDTKIHSQGGYLIVDDASIVLKEGFKENVQQLVKLNKRRIIQHTIKISKRSLKRFSYTRYLPVKKIRVFVYDTDNRVRRLRNSGLPRELIATIEINSTKKISTIDIIGGKVEQIGKYRIVWNKSWLDATQTTSQ